MPAENVELEGDTGGGERVPKIFGFVCALGEKSKVGVDGETGGGARVPKIFGFACATGGCGEDMAKDEVLGVVLVAKVLFVGEGVNGARTASRIPSIPAPPTGGTEMLGKSDIVVFGLVWVTRPYSDPSEETEVELSG